MTIIPSSLALQLFGIFAILRASSATADGAQLAAAQAHLEAFNTPMKLYHATLKEFAHLIIEGAGVLKPSVNRDSTMLGPGIYFAFDANEALQKAIGGGAAKKPEAQMVVLEYMFQGGIWQIPDVTCTDDKTGYYDHGKCSGVMKKMGVAQIKNLNQKKMDDLGIDAVYADWKMTTGPEIKFAHMQGSIDRFKALGRPEIKSVPPGYHITLTSIDGQDPGTWQKHNPKTVMAHWNFDGAADNSGMVCAAAVLAACASVATLLMAVAKRGLVKHKLKEENKMPLLE